MAWSKLTDMELDDEDQLDMPPVTASGKPIRPEYPYGLRISLCEKELTKLGLQACDAEIGDMIDMRAFAVVTSISMNQDGGGDSCRVELQIQKIAVENEMTESEDD